MVTLIVVVVSLVVFITLTILAYQFGKAVGKGTGRAMLKRAINEMTVRELLEHKRNNLKNI
jgi:hypothetical protein